MESYLIYLQTEAKERKNYRSDLYGLRRVVEDVGNHYDRQDIKNLFISTDFPSTPRSVSYTHLETELLETLRMERSTYYDRKKEAIKIFGLSLWWSALPQIKQALEEPLLYE